MKTDASLTGAIKRKAGSNDLFELDLEDGSWVTATHVIAADGKWSSVRSGAANLETLEDCRQKLSWHIHTEPSWGVLLHLPEIDAGWRRDLNHIILPKSLKSVYALCQPLANGQTSASVVFFDEILRAHPWINVPAAEEAARPWAGFSVGADPSWRRRMANLLRAELPGIAAAATTDVLAAAVQNRRASWVEVDRFHLLGGRAALVGDAAHSMTASIGEGCNCALESAVALASAHLRTLPPTP